MTNLLPYIWVFLFSACLGSFLNVCIYRIPLNRSIVSPPSSCTRCGRAIRWHDNIPILSYIFLRGRCRSCGAGISVRYPFIELLTALLMSLLYWHFTDHLGLGNRVFAVHALMTAGLIAVTFIDIDYRIIPDRISIPGMVLGPVAAVFIRDLHPMSGPLLTGEAGLFVGIFGFILFAVLKILLVREKEKGEKIILTAFISVPVLIAMLIFMDRRSELFSVYSENRFLASLSGVLMGGGVVWIQGAVGKLIFRKEAMGKGDVKLMAAIGGVIGWKSALLVAFCAPIPGALVGGVCCLASRSREIAYGPYLAGTAVVMIFAERPILDLFASGIHP